MNDAYLNKLSDKEKDLIEVAYETEKSYGIDPFSLDRDNRMRGIKRPKIDKKTYAEIQKFYAKTN